MRRTVQIRFLTLSAIALWMMGTIGVPVSGHSVMERSDPAPNTALDSPPRAVMMRFSEPVDPTFTTVIVRDEAGHGVSGATSVSADGRIVSVPLIDIPRGVLTVRWHVLSALDGHTTTGFFIISVGRPLPTGGRPQDTAPPFVTRLAARWLAYLAAIFLAGCAAFRALVLRPGLRTALWDGADDVAAATAGALRRACVGAAGLLVTALVADVVLQLAELTAGPVLEARGVAAVFLFGTRPGWSAMVQAGMAGLILIPQSPRGRILQASAVWWIILTVAIMTALGGPATVVGSTHLALLILASSVYALLGVWAAFILPHVADVRIPQMSGVPVVAGAGLLMGIALRSHAAGDGIPALLGDWVHLAAAALWIGGLASLWIALRAAPARPRADLARALVPGISRLSGSGLAVIVATGVYATWLNVPGVGALVATPYGRVLLAKLAAVAAIAGLGAYNRFVLRPAIAGNGPRPESVLWRFSRAITAEVALGAAALLAVTALTMMPPARVTYRPQRPAPVAMSGAADAINIDLRISPSGPGADRFEVAAADAGGPLRADTAVRLRLTKLDEDLTAAAVVLTAQPDGRYVAEGGYLLLDGWWEIDVIVRRMGRPDAVATFPFARGTLNAAATDAAASAEAERLLTRARAAAATLRSWREDERSGDEGGRSGHAQTEFQPPRRLRYRDSSGIEGVVIGSSHYLRNDGGPWRQTTDAAPRPFDGAAARLSGTERAQLGRRAACPDEDCQVVLWESRDRAARFAGWIGISSGRLAKLFMVAGPRWMTIEVSGVDAPIRVDVPR
jgi:copper transport protein